MLIIWFVLTLVLSGSLRDTTCSDASTDFYDYDVSESTVSYEEIEDTSTYTTDTDVLSETVTATYAEPSVGSDGERLLLDSATTIASEVVDPPSFYNPTLEGPVVIDRRWVEFYCSVPTNETGDEAAFSVTFLFDSVSVPSVPAVVVRSPFPRATLHERYLTNKLLGRWISCRVFSFWSNASDPVRSLSLTSTNNYWAGIQVLPHRITIYEGNTRPIVLIFASTIPVTCGQRKGAVEDSCDLILKLTTPKDILVRRRNGRECTMMLTEKDWKAHEQKAYGLEDNIEVFAKIDSFMTGPRWNRLTVDIDNLPEKVSADAQSYRNMWSRHTLPDIWLYRHDTPQGVCTSSGDPHITTFDYHYYTTFARGQFTYMQTTRGTPIEVQLRHQPCGQWGASCVCGVAAREDDIILIADMCADSRLHYITYNDKLREGASIKRDDNGRVFEINLPSKVKVAGYVNYWGLSTSIYVTSTEYRRTEGLCGSFDKNRDNDLKVKGGRVTNSVNDVVESWRVPLGKSLFDGVITTLPAGNDSAPDHDDNRSSFCTCLHGVSSCQRTMTDDSFLNGPNVGANKNIIPKTVRKFADNKFNRGKRASAEDSITDDIDWEYDSSSFNFSSPEPSQDTQNASRMSEEEAKKHCRRVLWDESSVKANCGKLVSMKDVDGIIEKCILDIKVTGDTSWADDKIPEIQNLCIFEAMTSNITESNSTIEEILSFVQEITAVVCLPQDCSGHGNCSNGTCICEKGYVGSDCALSKDAVPDILRMLGPSSCDLDSYLCQKVEMVTKDVKSLPELTCRVEVTKTDGSKQSINTLASVETMATSSCKLPTDALHGSLRPFLRSNSTPTTPPSEIERVDIHSLPQGNPVLHYSISISNNGFRFSNTRSLTVYDSKCYSCTGHSCPRKEESCLINGYCFAKGQRNPLSPECDSCNPSVSTTVWTKLSNFLCDPCLSSPCSDGNICQSSFKGKYRCIEKQDITVTVVAIVTVVAVILTIVVVYLILRRR